MSGETFRQSVERIVADALPTADFAAPDGRQVDAEGLAHFERAVALQRELPHLDFAECARATDPDAPAFVAPPGCVPDPEGLAHHERAVDFQRRNEGVTYMDAVRATAAEPMGPTPHAGPETPAAVRAHAAAIRRHRRCSEAEALAEAREARRVIRAAMTV